MRASFSCYTYRCRCGNKTIERRLLVGSVRLYIHREYEGFSDRNYG